MSQPLTTPTQFKPSVAPGPLSPEHLHTLTEAQRRAKKIRRAASVATLSGWTLVLFAAVSLITALVGNFASLLVGLALGVAAFNELRGGAMLRRIDRRGPKLLAFNQIGLGVLIVVYAAWSLLSALRNPAMAALGGSSGDAEVDAMVGRIAGMVTFGLYGSMIVVGIFVPGLTAWYYFSRRRLIDAMLKGTPDWVIQTMRAAG